MLLVNAAKRAEVIPTSAFTQLVAPLAQILALALVTALYVAFGRRTGTFGLVAYLLNTFALTALVGVEFVINLVFSDLPKATVDALRAGSLGVALTVASVSFLLGTLMFVAAMVRGREIPTVPLVLYAVGAVPVAFRAFVPEAALDLGLVTLALGIGWLAIWLSNRSGACCLGGNPLIPAGGADNEWAAHAHGHPLDGSKPLTGMSGLTAVGRVFALVSGLCGRLDDAQGAGNAPSAAPRRT